MLRVAALVDSVDDQVEPGELLEKQLENGKDLGVGCPVLTQVPLIEEG